MAVMGHLELVGDMDNDTIVAEIRELSTLYTSHIILRWFQRE